MRAALIALFLTGPLPALADSPYAGQETRPLKMLSDDDIAQIRAGQGWGLAKVAELNGVPGPAHLLELKDDIPLSPEQVTRIEAIFDQMKTDAIAAGSRYLAAEEALEMAFATSDIDESRLATLLDAVAKARRDLQMVHLSRHLSTPQLLTPHQILRYNQLRGYGAGDPCTNIPKGHDPAMWKKHNGCD